MKEFKLSTGQDVSIDVINPTLIMHLDFDFTKQQLDGMADVVDMGINLPDKAKELKVSEKEMLASYGNLLTFNHEGIEKVKKAFLEITDKLMAERVGEDIFKNYFINYDTLVYGTMMSSGTMDSTVRHNHPWTYSGVLFLKTPKNIDRGEAALMFINPNVSSEQAENYGILPTENHMVIFPSHLLVKDRGFRSTLSTMKEIRATLNLQVLYLHKNLNSIQPKVDIGKGITDEEFEKMKANNGASDSDDLPFIVPSKSKNDW